MATYKYIEPREPQLPSSSQAPNRLPFGEEPSEPLEKIIGDVVGVGMRGIESAIGTPGTLLQGLQSLGNIAAQKTTGYRPFGESVPLPTIESLREDTKKAYGQAFEPKTKLGSFGQDVASDVVSLLSPIPGIGGMAGKTALKAAGFGNIVKHGAKEFGFGEGVQGVAKIGTMLATSLFGAKSLDNVAKELFEVVEKEPPSVWFSQFKPLAKPLSKLSRIEKMGGLPKIIENISKEIKDAPFMSAQKLVDFYRTINAQLKTNIPSNIKGPLGELLDGFSTMVSKTKDLSPEWADAFKKSNEIYRTIQTTSPLNAFIQRITAPLVSKFINPLTAGILGHATGHLPLTIGVSGGAHIVRGVANVMDNVLGSPAIRKEYIKMAGAAVKENAPAVLKYAHSLDKAVQKEQPREKKQKFRYITPRH